MADPLGLFALFLCLIQVARSSGQFESPSPPLRQDCFALGLSSNLLCSSCSVLPNHGLESLVPDCQTCCHKDNDAEDQKLYPKAILEVCSCKLGRFPQIQAFVKGERAQNFPNLEIKFKRGADPALKFLNEKNQVQETLSIERWNTDTVEEFLQERLMP
uniref:Selenoprotein F n=1 Tax=Patiria miniata TaxID=46514 RepID=A0A914AJW0_PATMI